MATRRRNLFLYLTIVCFFGLVVIFIVDGYMGVYETIHITTGEREQAIEPDFWVQQGRFFEPTGSASVNRDEKAFFRYVVDNRRLSGYSDQVQVSVFRSQRKIADLLAEPVSVPAFGKQELTWTVDSSEVVPADWPPEQNFEFTVVIRRGGIERKIIIFLSPRPFVPKPPGSVPLPLS
ncbi:MAG: hypothetical protein HYX91_00715 [Chloroflexi bacterium]|nr:hypothetical protein [Chloroflexota bacterium]